MPPSATAGRKRVYKERGVVLTDDCADCLRPRVTITASTLPRTSGSRTIESLETRNVARSQRPRRDVKLPSRSGQRLSARSRVASGFSLRPKPRPRPLGKVLASSAGGLNFATIAFRDSGRRRRRTSTRRLIARTIPHNGHPDREPEP